MKVVALVSGGKDSCFNMMQCEKYGHEIVALANLLPSDCGVDELDSFMFQTVGHQLVAAYAECTGLPLYRRQIRGASRNTAMRYRLTENDEVEDLFVLLQHIKRAMPEVQAVSSGAIASDYQRLRVEGVCSRLGLVSLSYLWKQPQEKLLREMIDTGIHAILVKVAALGLSPKFHLGKSLEEMQGIMHNLERKFGLNVCGEGGEYETLTLDCPLFKFGRIVLDKWNVVEVSQDTGGAPVGHISVESFHVEGKEEESSPEGRGNGAGRETGSSPSIVYVLDADQDTNSVAGSRLGLGFPDAKSLDDARIKREQLEETGGFLAEVCSGSKGHGLMLIRCSKRTGNGEARGVKGNQGDLLEGAQKTAWEVKSQLAAVRACLGAHSLTWDSALFIRLYLTDMTHFAEANRAYSDAIPEEECTSGVPSRATVELEFGEQGCFRRGAVGPTRDPTREVHQGDATTTVDAGIECGDPYMRNSFLDILVSRENSLAVADSHGRSAPSAGGAQAMDEGGRDRWQQPNGPQLKEVLHVRSISCWAPSCIGPYSQCTRYRDLLLMAGQLGLDPPAMELVRPRCTNGMPRRAEVAASEARRALQSCEAVAGAVGGALFPEHCVTLQVYCCTALVGAREREAVLGEVDRFFGRGEGGNVGACGEEGHADTSDGNEGNEEEEDGEMERNHLAPGAWTSLANSAWGKARGCPGMGKRDRLHPCVVFLGVPALPKGAAVEIAPVVWNQQDQSYEYGTPYSPLPKKFTWNSAEQCAETGLCSEGQLSQLRLNDSGIEEAQAPSGEGKKNFEENAPIPAVSSNGYGKRRWGMTVRGHFLPGHFCSFHLALLDPPLEFSRAVAGPTDSGFSQLKEDKMVEQEAAEAAARDIVSVIFEIIRTASLAWSDIAVST